MDKQALKEFKDLVQRKLQFVIDELKKVVGNSAIELLQMNKGKRGRPFSYSETEIVNASAFRFLMKQGLRQTAVLVKALAEKCASYSQLCRRMASLGIKWTITKIKRKGRLLAIDGSGISTDYRGDYRSSKYKVRQRFYKLHAIVDAETNELIDYKLTSDKVGDNKKFLPMVRESASKGDTVYADGAYDSRDNFDYLDKHGIKEGIRIRKNFSIKQKGSPARWKAVIEQFGIKSKRLKGRMHFLFTDGFVLDENKIGYHQAQWKKKSGYGKRTSVERFYSAFKAVFGGHASSRKWNSLRKEMLIKCLTYNKLLKVT